MKEHDEAPSAAATPEATREQPAPTVARKVEDALLAAAGGPAPHPMASMLDEPTRAGDAEVASAAEVAREDSTGLRPFDMLGAYQILRRLGGGGMAEVYLARAKLGAGVEKLVAIKTARPAYGPDTALGALFLNEARVSATLQHPNVVQVFDFGEAAGRPYLAMEFLHGRELHDVLAKVNDGLPLPVDFVVTVLAEVCEALEYVHNQRALDGAPLNLVHRDVSPSNVLITSRGQVKLMDFGVAARQDDGGGLVVGKHAFMAPEQAEGASPSPRWDVYAVGAIINEFLSRSRFSAAPTGGPVEVLGDLAELAKRATAGDPGQRIATAAELGGELRRLALHLERTDVGRTLRALFGEELAQEESAVERLVQEGRRRAPDNTRALPFPLRTLKAWRRRIASTRWAMRLAARPALRRGLIAALLLVVLGGGAQAAITIQRAQALTEAVRTADARISEGRLVGPGGDHALDHLLRARAQAPEDLRIQRRLRALAETFERLGDAAVVRGDHAEAAVHLQAALQAAPDSAQAREKLTALETAVRDQSRQRTRASEP